MSNPPDRADSFELLRCVWPFLPETAFRNQQEQYSRFLAGVGDQLDSMEGNHHEFAPLVPNKIFEVVTALRKSGDVTKEQAFAAIHTASPSPLYNEGSESCSRVLRCAVSIWLSIGINPRISDADNPSKWASDETLKSKITTIFEAYVMGANSVNSVKDRHLHQLTAASLCRRHGYSIEWTHDLYKHLSVDYQRKILRVYEDKIVAYNHIRPGAAKPPVPNQLFEETIDTLNLLFPCPKKETEKLLKKHGIAFYTLGLCGRPRKLHLSDYRYWKTRIANIHDIFQTPLTGFQQLLVDDEGKNMMSTFTFWITSAACIVALLGIGLAVLSLVYSVKQYNLGLEQYRLSVVQACGDSHVRDKLVKLCSSYE